MPPKPPPAKPLKPAIIYQTKSGQISFRDDLNRDTIWATQHQIANLFDRNKSVISRHIKNILQSGELPKTATVAKIATVQKEGNRHITRKIDHYNLDMMLSVGYRVDSKQATQFRIWATKTLTQHLLSGYTINKQRITNNYDQFMAAVAQIQELLPNNDKPTAHDTLNLIKAFATAWISLDTYDTEQFPKNGTTHRKVEFTATQLTHALAIFKNQLIHKKQTTNLFGKQHQRDALSGIVGNIFQTFDGKDIYPTIEEKAAHLLYFIVKNHPFTDGNKRSGAFAFIWFLHKANILKGNLTPEALTTLTLLIAESTPTSKDKMIGLVLLLLRNPK